MINTVEPTLNPLANQRPENNAQNRGQNARGSGGQASEPKPRPRLGCAGLIRSGDKVLLGKRNKEPNRGLWVLPGGGVEFCETFAQTLERELLEEAGIGVAVRNVFKTYELINPPNEHRVIVYLLADYLSGSPTPSSDLSEVSFFGPDELRKMSEQRQISPFVEKVLIEAELLEKP